MRTSLLLLLALTPTWACAASREGIVKADVAEVRSGPSDSKGFYVTNRLVRGVKVEVIEELPGGWLKIKPPPGSFSWIKTVFLEEITPNQPTYVVAMKGQEVPVIIGGDLRLNEGPKDRPNVVGAKVKAGTQVTAFANEVLDPKEGKFIRIYPPPSEVRYLKKSALETATFAPVGGVAAPGVASGPLPVATTPSANPATSPARLWDQAIQQERAGRYEEAISMWSKIAEQTTRTHPQASTTANARAVYLRGFLMQRSRSVQAGPTSTFRPSTSYRGRVVKQGETYRLEVVNTYGLYQHAFYLSPGPGVGLGSFAGSLVEVWGSRDTRNRGEHLTVSRIEVTR